MYIKVRVVTKQKKSALEKVAPDTFRAHVRAVPERGLANKEVLQLLREYFPYAKTIKLVSGHTSPSKIFSLEEKVV